MGGVRKDAISGRDLEVLELIARLGVAPRSVVAEWSGNGDRSGNYRRERRLLDARYVAACPPFAESGPVVRITRRGLRACGREELWEPRYSDSRVKHALDVGRVGVAYERAGQAVLFERELIARERSDGDRPFSAELSGRRLHRPDLVLLDKGGPPVVVEVELSAKAGARLDEIMRAWRRAIVRKKVSGVVYRCSSRAGRWWSGRWSARRRIRATASGSSCSERGVPGAHAAMAAWRHGDAGSEIVLPLV